MLSNGDTLGVFQLESPGMKNLFRKLKPSSIEDIGAANALYRPGPMSQILIILLENFIKKKWNTHMMI